MSSSSNNQKVAITGGIGSGKSFVCQRLAAWGIHVYDCDAGAKRLMRTSLTLQRALSELVGQDLFPDGQLQKRALAAYLLQNEEHKQAVNAVVHPAVAHDFEQSGMNWLESAIYYDSGFHARVNINKVVAVMAPLDVRVYRIMTRDRITREKALEWIGCQLPQEDICRRADYVILNDGHTDIDSQIAHLLAVLDSSGQSV